MVIITVGGPPGSGTSTLCNGLSEKLGYDYIYAGEIFRQQAKSRGMTLSEFGRLCEKDRNVDISLDRKMIDLARENDGMILEGRMTGPLCFRERIPSFKIFVKANPEIRAARLLERDGGNIEEKKREMLERENSERNRYLSYYNMDPSDETYYDLVMDSSNLTPRQEVQIIMKELDVKR